VRRQHPARSAAPTARTERLIVQPLLREHGDGLRHIEQRRVGAGGGTDAAGTIRGFPLAGDHNGAGVIIHRFGLCGTGQSEEKGRRQQQSDTHHKILRMTINIASYCD
jgi:hypothetical protein